MTFNSSALVLDGRSHTSLAIIRNLGRHGISVRTVDILPRTTASAATRKMPFFSIREQTRPY